MFSKILIANRGEIACRVIKTARRLGIKTVAVYSEADKDALHVEMADEALGIGPAPAAESYLVIDKILRAIKTTGSEAVHPGYGFLSENMAFAEALAAEGIAFIGPNPRAIGAMGDKIESKKLAKEAGVSTVPGYLGAIPNAEDAVGIAADIGFPVMIKASAGGGGKGMRIAYSADEVKQGFESAVNEAKSSFGDDRVFIEKFIEDPRHIEIQVLGDKHGNCIHLGERECSIQRRHQKVIEEAPSPYLLPETREAMGGEAVALAKAVDYDSAGTVEFIADQNQNYFFLEMNTRLQVEHPVTECITGIDLVEQMIRSAAGEKLALSQDDVTISGHSVEARVYAEDPFRKFLPSIGRLTYFRPPAESVADGKTLRIDTGVYEGAEISMFYDPMIAKVVTHAPERLEAVEHMAASLDGLQLEGIRHNVPFLAALMRHERFRAGNLSTNFIAEEYPEGFEGGALQTAERQALLAIAVFVQARAWERQSQITGQLREGGLKAAPQEIVAREGKTTVPCRYQSDAASVTVQFEGRGNGGKQKVVSDWKPGEALFTGTVGGRTITALVDRAMVGYRLTHGGATLEISVERPRIAELAALMPEKVAPDTSKFLLCPMPGILVSINVKKGQEVKTGEALAVVEAMKMENVLRAERDGVIETIRAEAGASLAADDVILEFEG